MKYFFTALNLMICIFLGLTVLDIFQENMTNPAETWDGFRMGIVTLFCVWCGFTFFLYKHEV